MRISKEKSIGLLIDVQDRLVPLTYEYTGMLHHMQALLNGLHLLGVPILWTEQYSRGLGETVEPLRTILMERSVEPPIEKMCFSCCDSPEFMEKLAVANKQFVIIAGIETHICVMQTVVDLIELGYVPVVIEDCMSSRTQDNKRIGIQRMQSAGAIISSVESILFELCRVAGTDVFKHISKLVK